MNRDYKTKPNPFLFCNKKAFDGKRTTCSLTRAPLNTIKKLNKPKQIN